MIAWWGRFTEIKGGGGIKIRINSDCL